MPNVTIRDVPPHVHEVLLSNAARKGQSLQQYLLGVLGEVALTRSRADWVADIEARMAADPDWPQDLPNAGDTLREERDARR